MLAAVILIRQRIQYERKTMNEKKHLALILHGKKHLVDPILCTGFSCRIRSMSDLILAATECFQNQFYVE
jgi:hypothetical protein